MICRLHPLLRSRLLRVFLLYAFGAGLQAQPVIHSVVSAPVTPVLVQSPLQFQADASVAGGGALEYRWDFGDGTPRTDWLSVANAGHSYTGAGIYTVLLQVRHASQGLASATLRIVVRLPVAAAARQSSPIIVHGARREVWVVNPDHGSVSVLDADALTRLAEIAVGAHPSSLAIAADGQVWVSVRDADRLKRIDPINRVVNADIDLGHGAKPVALAIAANGAGYISLAGPGRVRRFDAASGILGPSVVVGADVEALALSGAGDALYVSKLISAGASGTVWSIALPDFTAADAIALPLDSTSPDSGTAARGLPNYVAALALAEDGQNLWYAGKKDNILRGMHREGLALTFESVLRSLIGRIDATAAGETVAARIDSDDSGRVSALLLPPGSSHLFAAQETNNRVLVFDPWNRREMSRVSVGLAPQGLAFDIATRRLYVHNFLSRNVSVFAVGDMLDDGVSTAQSLGSIATTVTEVLGDQVLAGKRVFYDASDIRMSQDGYTACVACHLDGRSDGRVWDFTQLGEGLRNTTSLRGAAGMGRGLVHWSGNFDEIQDFEVPIRNLFGGIGFMNDADYFSDGRNHPLGPSKAGFSSALDALAMYVSTLDQDDRSPHRNPDASITAQGIAGRQLFTQLNCQRCHSGPDFSDSIAGFRHDVATLGPGSGQRLGEALLALDTPSLRGLFASAPYLHDGSATSLLDVLTTRNVDGMHGDSGALSAPELAQLESFLLQIDGNEPGLASAASLLLTAPTAGLQIAPQQSIDLAIVSDLPQITSVEYLIDGSVVATANAPPWQASWTAAIGNQAAVHVYARVQHDQGRFNTLSAPVPINLLGDSVFQSGFE